MRHIRLLVAAFVVGVAVFGPVGSAWAAEGEVSHASEECIELLEAGGTIDDCQAAPNPLLPETNEIIWGGITFAIVFAFLAWKGYPMAKKAMDERTAKIAGDIDGAERSKAEADQVLEQYRAQLADARAESNRIIEEARQTAETLRRDLIAKAEAEADELRQRNTEQVAAERDRVMAELQASVSTLAIDLAEKVVGASLDREANARLIEDYINTVGASGASQ